MHTCACVCVCVCVCVCPCACACACTPPRPQNQYATSGVILTLHDWLNNDGSFSVPVYDSCSQCY